MSFNAKQLLDDLLAKEYSQEAIAKVLDYFRQVLAVNFKHYLSDLFEIAKNVKDQAKKTPAKVDDEAINELLLLLKDLLTEALNEIDKILK